MTTTISRPLCPAPATATLAAVAEKCSVFPLQGTPNVVVFPFSVFRLTCFHRMVAPSFGSVGHSGRALLSAVAIILTVAVAAAERDIPKTNVERKPGAEAVVDAPVWEAGDIRGKQSLRHDFVLRNRGKKALLIKEVRTSCGSCLSAYARTDRIPPEKSTEITVTLHAARIDNTGRSWVFVETNAPATPIVRLAVRYRVTPEPVPKCTITPRSRALGLMSPGQTAVATFTITNEGDAPLLLTRTTIGSEKSHLRWAEQAVPFPVELAPGDALSLTVSYTPKSATGITQVSAGIVCNDPEQRRHFLAVTAYVASREEIRRQAKRLRED